MAFLAIAGTIISSVAGAAGAMMQANAAAAAATQNANIAAYNAEVANRNKKAALALGQNEQVEQSRVHARQLGHIRAAYGASGLALSGSPLDVIQDTALEQELDIKKIGYRAETKAAGYEDQRNEYLMRERLLRSEASSARAAGPISAIGTFFGGVSRVGSSLMSVS